MAPEGGARLTCWPLRTKKEGQQGITYQESVGQCLRTGLVQLCAKTAVKLCVCGIGNSIFRRMRGR